MTAAEQRRIEEGFARYPPSASRSRFWGSKNGARRPWSASDATTRSSSMAVSRRRTRSRPSRSFGRDRTGSSGTSDADAGEEQHDRRRGQAAVGHHLSRRLECACQCPGAALQPRGAGKNLATLFTDLYGPHGLIVDSEATLPGEQPHSAHFTSDFQSNFSQFSTALVSQLVTVPLPSPASGFTYRVRPEHSASSSARPKASGRFSPSAPKRSAPAGLVRLCLSALHVRHGRGLDLDACRPSSRTTTRSFCGGREDVVTTLNSSTRRVNQFTTFVTVGVTDRLDVSLAVPDRLHEPEGRLRRDDSAPRHHQPADPFLSAVGRSIGTRRLFTALGSASGFGDSTIRMKGQRHARPFGRRWPSASTSACPRDDALNLLGTGAPGLQPFVVWSATRGRRCRRIVNAGYQWNGSSVLAGNPATGQSGDLPGSSRSTRSGADVSTQSRSRIAFDVARPLL